MTDLRKHRPLTDEEEYRLRQADAWPTLDRPCTDCDGEGYIYERVSRNEVNMIRCESCKDQVEVDQDGDEVTVYCAACDYFADGLTVDEGKRFVRTHVHRDASTRAW